MHFILLLSIASLCISANDLKFFRIISFKGTSSEVIKLFSCSTQLLEIFSANKYKNANNSWHFHIYIVGIFIFISREIFMLSYVQQERILQLLVICDLLAGQISCSVELSMKKVL